MSSGFYKTAYRLFLVSILFVLSACGGVSKHWDHQGYTVKKGDTLYSIAWRYEKDFRQIAEWNDIHPPYSIYPGQRLVMQGVNRDGTLSSRDRPQVLVESKTGREVSEESISKPQSKRPKQIEVQKYDTLYAISRRHGLSPNQIARWNRLKSPYVLRPGQKLRLTPPSSSLGQIASRPAPAAPATKPLSQPAIQSKPLSASSSAKKLPVRVGRWQWPVSGRVVQSFKANDMSRKGIAIRGKRGQKVKAAAGGKVVYSGNGLINYGNLVIIKHSHSFLSAYAHNQALLVKEGDSVKPGQVIARMGSENKAKAKLHFEIRRNGKPVNPLHYLPKS